MRSDFGSIESIAGPVQTVLHTTLPIFNARARANAWPTQYISLYKRVVVCKNKNDQRRLASIYTPPREIVLPIS